MDPFIIIKYGTNTYRTRVIRHDLNPLWGDKFILPIKRLAPLPSSTAPSLTAVENSTVTFELLDWEQVGKDELIGTAVLELQELLDEAPKPDEETALYNEEAMRVHGFKEIPLSLALAQRKDRWEANSSAIVVVR